MELKSTFLKLVLEKIKSNLVHDIFFIGSDPLTI